MLACLDTCIKEASVIPPWGSSCRRPRRMERHSSRVSLFRRASLMSAGSSPGKSVGHWHSLMYCRVSDDGSGTATLYAPLRAVLPSVNLTISVPSTSNTPLVFNRRMSPALPAVIHAISRAALRIGDVHSIRACWMCKDVAGNACNGSSMFASICAPLSDVRQMTEFVN
eukprot:TRINITY_DN3029_c0_g1_i16.p3 TRINITY_DN3029_c0_g1~~TRINITY_DN3029_c0_g1_i16.p3  ORF type:complete len:169 (+),score=0.38 TRINITY_DN3029_c0_g1_i16:2641-3147(+)